MAVIARLLHAKATSKDSLLSWIALLASTFIAVCSVGFIYIFSICFNALLDKFGESKGKTGMKSFLFEINTPCNNSWSFYSAFKAGLLYPKL